MRDYRLTMISRENATYSFGIYVQAPNGHEAVDQANKTYWPHFEVDRMEVVEVLNDV